MSGLPMWIHEGVPFAYAMARNLAPRRSLCTGCFDDAAVERTGLAEQGQMVGEVGIARGRSEVAVPPYQRLERIEEVQAPLRIGRPRDAPPADVEEDRAGVGQHGIVEGVGVGGAARRRGDPGRPAFGVDGAFER